MKLDEFTKYVFSFVAGLVIGALLTAKYNSCDSTPVEKNEIIDSLVTANDSIKLKVEHLDSIKNAKVIEVSTLDNDSTLKLFYKLVSE